jgi:hypothetical protein
LLSANLAFMAVNATTFSSDGSTYWSAAPGYSSIGACVPDIYYSMNGNPSAFTAGNVQNIIQKYIAAKSGTTLPICVEPDGVTGIFYSGCDTQHNFPAADGATQVPLMEGLYFLKSRSTAQFSSDAATLKAALLAIPRNGTNHLVTAVTPWTPWAFYDGVQFTGDNLMGSLAYWQAATQMATLYTAIGDSTNAALFTSDAASIVTGLSTLWDSTDGMFYASSGQNHQIDIGSAYAVWLGVTTGPQTTAISNYLVSNVSTLSKNGAMHTSNTNWATSWGGNQCGNGTGNYIDGAWGTGLYWVAYSMTKTSPSAAVALIATFANSDMGQETVGATANGKSQDFATPSWAYKFVVDNPTLFPVIGQYVLIGANSIPEHGAAGMF